MSQTGIAGLTLGGGMGGLMRAQGLSCDNLRSIEIVTADGAVRTPLMDLSATMNYVDIQSAPDPAFPAGGRYFFKSHFLDTLTDEVIDRLLDCDAVRRTRSR